MDKVLEVMDVKKVIFVVFLDLLKVFNSIDYVIFFVKLQVICFCYGLLFWIMLLNIVYEVEVMCGKFINKMVISSDSVEFEFWYKNIIKIFKVINFFVEDFVEKNLLIKVIVIRGYKFFYEEYIYDIEGEFC